MKTTSFFTQNQIYLKVTAENGMFFQLLNKPYKTKRQTAIVYYYLNPFTPNMSIKILLTICHTFLINFVLRI